MGDVKVGIIGQSNSVMRAGYAAALESMAGVTIARRATLGSSSAILAAYFAPPDFFSGLDFCVVDLVVFDYHVAAVSEGLYTAVEIIDVMNYVVHAARASGCEPIILTLEPEWMSLSHGWIGHTHLRLATKWHLPFFDFCRFALDILGVSKLEVSSLYSDPNHPAQVVQERIAVILADFMRWRQASSTPECTVRAALPQFEITRPTVDNMQVIVHANSLVSESCIVISQSEVLILRYQGGGPIRAMVVASTGTAGRFAIEGHGRVVKDLSTESSSRPGFILRVAPIFGDVRARDGVVRMYHTADPTTERHIGESSRWTEVSLELSAVIFEADPVMVVYSAPQASIEECDIVSWSVSQSRSGV